MVNHWIRHPLILKGRRVELRPVEEDALDELFDIGRDREIWRLTSVDYSDSSVFYPNFKTALHDREQGKAYPFLVCLGNSGRIIGTTRLLDVQPRDKKVEIGVTWIASAFWGSGINTECKQLLLAYCFEILDTNRVQFRTKAGNARSRRALEKIGAVFEGVMRKDKIESNGNPRDTAFYSIVREDWPRVKIELAAQLAAH